ncbi:MAG TPA: HAMP domain-containing sensor histidine kinase [Verrucomicrobiae bacterium]
MPAEYSADPELSRRARLVSRFGTVGAIFGIIYSAFYILIGHKWGALIILVCSPCFAAAPFLLRRKNSLQLAGHFLTFVLTLGFTALCCVEGGLNGHAMAWLVCVPLCALLLLGQKAALRWAGVIFLIASIIAGLDLAGIHLPTLYDSRWNPYVSAGGYLGLIIFMFALGLIFEAGRAQAFSKMRDALAELAQTNERLVYLNNEKNEFLGIAAHDLKNPLTVVMGSAELARTVKDQDKAHKLLSNISAAAARMRDLITNLLDVNAIEEGKFTSRVEPCDIRALVERSVENNHPVAARKSIAIRVGVSEGLWAKADPAATLQIMDNLISNALKFSPPNTTIHVHTLPEASHILISVRDEGPGISEADQKKLFGKFTRLSARPTGGESSTGLGLAIVKRLAEAMSGAVHCHSVPGAGATFTLRLPVCAPPAEPANTPSSAPVPVRAVAPGPTMEFPGRN